MKRHPVDGCQILLPYHLRQYTIEVSLCRLLYMPPFDDVKVVVFHLEKDEIPAFKAIKPELSGIPDFLYYIVRAY